MTRHVWHHPGILRAVGILLLFARSSQWCLRGVEKHVVAQQAQAILVGTFKPNPTFPWFDGWHLTGTLKIDEVLYGPPMPHEIELKFFCEWHSCVWWPPPRFPNEFSARGLWFLKRIDEKTWEQSLNPGFRNLSERGYWETYIRKYKH